MLIVKTKESPFDKINRCVSLHKRNWIFGIGEIKPTVPCHQKFSAKRYIFFINTNVEFFGIEFTGQHQRAGTTADYRHLFFQLILSNFFNQEIDIFEHLAKKLVTVFFTHIANERAFALEIAQPMFCFFTKRFVVCCQRIDTVK